MFGVVKNWVGRVFLFLHIFSNRTKSIFYHFERIVVELNHGFRTLFEVGMFFLLWDLEHGVRILDLKALIGF